MTTPACIHCGGWSCRRCGPAAEAAELERLRRELAEAREAVGEAWLSGGVSLADAIRRKTRVPEGLAR